uniref:RNA-dependent RNA polymerase n=1 Tax=Rhizoctonia solani dsRNA virus 5 TaxID=2126437 RepID=A0A2P1M8A9_9VIRU|nr:RNA-dependent RNA polymerase [Rhizoctonia solani dsRNA virus 5]
MRLGKHDFPLTHSRSLRYVARCQTRNIKAQRFYDPYSEEGLVNAVPEIQTLLDEVKQKWHRPEPDADSLLRNILRYGDELPARCTDGDYFMILKEALEELRPDEQIIPFTNGYALKHPDFPRSTSPGYPWSFTFKTKGQVIDDPVAPNYIHRAWDSIGRGIPWQLNPAEAFHRTVASENTKSKVRLTWGYPIDVVAEEARWFLPLFATLKKDARRKDFFYGLGLETALGGQRHIREHFDRAPPGSKVINGDLSEFDQHVTDWIIRDVFALLKTWFDFTKVVDSEGKVWNVNPAQSERRWNAMVSYFIKTKIRLPQGAVIQKFQGVPSGSMWTNLMDTIVNCVQMRTICRRMGLPIYKDYYYGDDSCIIVAPTPGEGNPIDLEEFSTQLKQTFGGILSPHKTDLFDSADGIHWLGYWSRPGNKVARDIYFLIASNMFPEREVVDAIDASTRLLGQADSTMSPEDCIPFLRAITFLSIKYKFTTTDVHNRIMELGPKRFKYLSTLGLDFHDFRVPPVRPDRHCRFGLRCDVVTPQYQATSANSRPLRRPNFSLSDRPNEVFLPPELLTVSYLRQYTISDSSPNEAPF